MIKDDRSRQWEGVFTIPFPWTLRHKTEKNDEQLYLPENLLLIFKVHFQALSQGLCCSLYLVLSSLPKSLNYRSSDGIWGRPRTNSRMLKTHNNGSESIYSSEVAKTHTLCSPAMVGELKTQNQYSPLWKTDVEFNPTATPEQRSGTKLLPTSPSGIRVLWLLSSKYLLQPLNRVKVSTSAGQASMRSHFLL